MSRNSLLETGAKSEIASPVAVIWVILLTIYAEFVNRQPWSENRRIYVTKISEKSEKRLYYKFSFNIVQTCFCKK